jgi:hypothetical protein
MCYEAETECECRVGEVTECKCRVDEVMGPLYMILVSA